MLVSCGISNELKEERKRYQFDNWQQQYKDRAFCKCLLEGFRNKQLQDSILKYDKSFYNPVAYALFDSSINILLKGEIQKMITDSIWSIGKGHPDLKKFFEGKKVTGHCLELYNSDRLKKVISQQKAHWKKIRNIEDEILRKVPTF